MQTIDWNLRATFTEILSLAFIYPTRELVEVLVSGEYREALDEVLRSADIDCSTAELDAYPIIDPDRILQTCAPRPLGYSLEHLMRLYHLMKGFGQLRMMVFYLCSSSTRSLWLWSVSTALVAWDRRRGPTSLWITSALS